MQSIILFSCIIFSYGHIIPNEMEFEYSGPPVMATPFMGVKPLNGYEFLRNDDAPIRNFYQPDRQINTGYSKYNVYQRNQNVMNNYILYHLVKQGDSCAEKKTALEFVLYATSKQSTIAPFLLSKYLTGAQSSRTILIFMMMLSNQYLRFQKTSYK